MSDKQILKKCKDLPYSNTCTLDDEVFFLTESKLSQLYAEYGDARVLAELYTLWSFEKAVSFFEKIRWEDINSREPKTIATMYYRGYNGGVERVNAELMKLWIGMGYRVVFISKEEKSPQDYPYPDLVKRVVIPGDDMTQRLLLLQKCCKEEKVDLVINHEWAQNSFLWECVLMKRMKIPYIQYCHGHFSFCLDWSRDYLFQPEAFKLCNLVLSLSEVNARFYQLSGCNTYRVNNPIPDDLKIETGDVKEMKSHILWVGRIAEEKYPMDALKVFKIIRSRCPDAVLDIVGDEDKRIAKEMQLYVNNEGLNELVVFHGKKDTYELASFYRSCACVLFTSKMEGYPMIVLESKAYKCPLVMYNLTFLSLIRDGLGVLTSPIGDLSALADNVVRILKDDRLRKKLAVEAGESFASLKKYDLRKTWKRIIDITCKITEDFSDPDYYTVDDISDIDLSVIPAIFDKMKIGYNNNLFNSRDYKVGNSLLKIPRIIKNVLMV